MKRLMFAAVLGLASITTAQAGRLVDVSVRDRDTGETLDLYRQSGRFYVAGDPGHRYAVTLRNNTPERVMVVLSVDGVNAISGQTAGAQQSGYVLAPWQQTEVRGWRKNLRETAEFYFTDLPDSYAARTGRPDNVGVIGVAVFRERVYQAPRPWDEARIGRDEDRRASEPAPRYRDKSATGAPPPVASAPSADGAARESKSRGLGMGRQQELGTGHGERQYDPASYTRFERRGDSPDEVIAIWYDGYEALADRGVIPRPHRHAHREADPFPNGFAPDPYR